MNATNSITTDFVTSSSPAELWDAWLDTPMTLEEMEADYNERVALRAAAAEAESAE